MNNLITIARREMGVFFSSTLFWVLATAFMLFGGLLFNLYISSPQAQASMMPLLSLYGTVLLFVTPLMAMRLLAEEQRSGTLELLMTSPVQDWQVVVGKWLGALMALLSMMALTLSHVFVMSRLSEKGLAIGPTLSSYLGLTLLCAALLALGVLTSSVTENQVVAGFLGVMLVLVLWFLPILNQIGTEASWAKALAYLGLSDHYMHFGDGLIDSRDLIYFVSLTFGCLFLATRILETRRWR